METSMIRNVAFISHGGAGKTSLIEAVLYNTGATQKIGNIESGTRQEVCRAVHAEQNAIISAAIKGVSIKGGTVYVNTYPC